MFSLTAAFARPLVLYQNANRIGTALLLAVALVACAGLPPGARFPKTSTMALAHPEQTQLGRQFGSAAQEHGGASAFRIISVGVDGFRARMQMIDAAQRTLDLQYYIFRGDETGRMLTDRLRHAADRGVRIRLLIDDADTVAGDEQVLRLAALPTVELRIFNPFSYRGHSRLLRKLDFFLHAPRLDYRMHNKLLVADNAVALVGGRNIGNQYFQVDPESQFADDDLFTAGAVVGELSGIFDQFWNSRLAIPVAALGRPASPAGAVMARSEDENAKTPTLSSSAIDYRSLLASSDVLQGIISGDLSLVWAQAQVVYDSPDKKAVTSGALPGSLIEQPVAESARQVRSELLLVTPFMVPDKDERDLLKDLRQRQVRVRVLTNSLESTPEPVAQSGYEHYRVPMLAEGIELNEIRSRLGSARGSGQTAKVSRLGNYALHAKLYVFDRQKMFIGSMNFDQRSKRINTEIGLIVDSSELARQTAQRFDAMIVPDNCYRPELQPAGASRAGSHLVWHTRENGQDIDYTNEPARSGWQRLKVKLWSLLPISGEL